MMNKESWFVLLLLVIVVAIIEAAAVHDIYVSTVLGGNDFYPRWAGARALLLEGRNPYSDEITQEIIAVLDPEDRGQNSFNFAYPLHVIFVFLPFAFLPYDWAIAFWMVIVQWLAIATVIVLLAYYRWKPSPLGLVGIILGTILFYPVARSILLGQFTVHVALLLALTILALKMHRDWLAGTLFALTSIKPQMVLLIGLWLLVWVIKERRFSFVWGVISGGVFLLLASMAFLLRWPLDFITSLGSYSELAGGKEPLQVFLKLFLSSDVLLPKILLLFTLGLATVFIWRMGLRGELAFESVLHWSIILNLLVFFQTGTTNQVLLLLPFVGWLDSARRKGRSWYLAPLVGALLVAIWLLFLQTIEGNYENPVLFIPLPFLALLICAFRIWRESDPFSDSTPASENAFRETV